MRVVWPAHLARLIIVLLMIDAVLLEFDGVIADTQVARRRALLETLAEDGVQLSAVEFDERCAAMPVRASVRAAFALRGRAPDETWVELISVRTERLFSELMGTGVSLVEGVAALIASAHSLARLGIVSYASRSDIDAVLALARLEHAFELIIAGDDAYQPKPSSASYIGALERLSRRRAVVPNHVVALEPGAVGIRAAKTAGIRCAAVGPLPIHLAVDADALIPSLVGQTIASIDALTVDAQAAGR
jgi:beta-phosphoglucomutase-like phosphatase (HAD superfamily)